MLSVADCSHCESFSLASLPSRIAFFPESDSAPRALPFSSSQGPVRKKLRGRGFEQPVTRELASAQCPHASLSQREHSVLFTQLDQYPSAAASDVISFGVSDNELDDSLSLVASDAEELSGSVADPALLPSSASSSARLKADDEVIRVMTKAVNELGLEPSRSRLDKCFLPGYHQALRQRSSPFFPKICMTSSRNLGACPIHLASAPLLQPLSLPLMALKRKDTSICLLWMSPWPHISARPWLSDGRRGRHIHPSHAELHLDGCASGFSSQDARQWGCRSGFCLTQGPEKCNGPGSAYRHSPKRLDALCPASSCWSANHGSRWRRWKRRIKFPSTALRTRQVACLDQLWRTSLNVSRRLRSRLKRCNNSSPNAPALLLLPVALNLHQLSRQPNQHQHPGAPTSGGDRDRGLSRSERRYNFSKPKDPSPRCLGSMPKSLPDQPAEGGGARISLPPEHPKQPLMCLSPPRGMLVQRKMFFGSSLTRYGIQVSERW